MHYSNLPALAAALSTIWFASPVSGNAIPNAKTLAERQTGYKWVDTWTSMPQLVEQANLPPSPFVSLHPLDREFDTS